MAEVEIDIDVATSCRLDGLGELGAGLFNSVEAISSCS